MKGMLPPNPVLVTRNYKKSQLRDMKGYLKGTWAYKVENMRTYPMN